MNALSFQCLDLHKYRPVGRAVTARIVGAVCLFLGLGVSVAPACRYNVRDVGFVDLESSPYRLFCYVDGSTEKDMADRFGAIAETELRGSNIRPIVVDVAGSPGRPALRYLSPATKNFPALVLVSPAKRTMPFELRGGAAATDETLRDVLGKIVSSPLRREIAEKAMDCLGVVLIVEGPNAEENRRANDVAQAAIRQVSNQMHALPKAVSRPPALLKMDPAQREGEAVLLWSMGIEPDRVKEPLALVFYGRGRRMASVLSGKEITRKMLEKFLYAIGADCECTLDRSWMRGEMMPARWTHRQMEKLSKELGFDPENPLVKIEMGQILRQGVQSGNEPPERRAPVKFGYREIKLGSIPSEPSESAPAQGGKTPCCGGGIHPPGPGTAADETNARRQKAGGEAPPPVGGEDSFELLNPLVPIGVAGAVVAVFGIGFTLLARRRGK